MFGWRRLLGSLPSARTVIVGALALTFLSACSAAESPEPVEPAASVAETVTTAPTAQGTAQAPRRPRHRPQPARRPSRRCCPGRSYLRALRGLTNRVHRPRKRVTSFRRRGPRRAPRGYPGGPHRVNDHRRRAPVGRLRPRAMHRADPRPAQSARRRSEPMESAADTCTPNAPEGILQLKRWDTEVAGRNRTAL